MAIQTSTFSGWRLSGEHAEAFRRQINDPTPNLLAKETMRRGRVLGEEYRKNGGYVVLKPIKRGKLTNKE